MKDTTTFSEYDSLQDPHEVYFVFSVSKLT
jgi:hypothetical protein